MNFKGLYKPSSWPTHKTDSLQMGFKEAVQNSIGNQWNPCHRLDKETSGLLLFADSKEGLQEITQLFTEHDIKKSYLLVVDEIILKKNDIQKVSTPVNGKSAETEFRLLKEYKHFQLIQASPLTGRTHQIRLHAKELGCAILGDEHYGGSPFFRLMLHAEELHIKKHEKSFKQEPPAFFRDLTLLDSQETCLLFNSLKNRESLESECETQCYRLINHEHPQLRVDQLGDVIHLGWWSEDVPNSKEMKTLTQFIEATKAHSWCLRHYTPKANERKVLISRNLPDTWLGTENRLNFEMRSDQGLSPGLFLDQRNNRKWALENSHGKRVLNLFAYTCGFSVASAYGGASQVISVDASSTYLNWGQENFKHNNIEPTDHRFLKRDVITYLKSTVKKIDIQNEDGFDIIFCDPPSFGRFDKKRFKLDKDFNELIELCLKCLNKKGDLIFSCNFEQWSYSKFLEKLQPIVERFRAQVYSPRHVQWDYQNHLERTRMKAFQISKK